MSSASDTARLDWLEREVKMRGWLLLDDGVNSVRRELSLFDGRSLRDAIDAASGWRKEAIDITEAQHHILVHALTGGKDFVYRRHYCASDGGPTYHICEALAARGLLRRFQDRTYHVTAAGAAAVGLHLPKE